MDDPVLPEIGSVFILTKKDSTDFDRDGVSRRLGIIPTKTCPPTVSPGKLLSEIDPAEFNTAGGISLARWQFIYIEMCDYVATQTEKKAAGEEYDEEAFDPTTGEPLFKY